jgi:hypothetical protein
MALYDGDYTYKGKPLFRATVMDSGSITPAGPIDCPKAQDVYSYVVSQAGCSSSGDTLACLRTVSYETLLKATTGVPGIFDYQYVALSYLAKC